MSGHLTIQLLDSTENPIPNQLLKLHIGSSVLEEATSNSNGLADFGSLNFGNYYVKGVNIEDSGIRYNFKKLIQVVTLTYNAFWEIRN